MTVFKGEVLKRSKLYPGSGGEWSNVYHVNATTQADAETAMVAAMDAELPLYSDQVEVYEIRISYPVGTPGPTKILPVSEFGSRTDVPGLLPNWNVARIDFGVPVASRTARKYIRASIGESDVEDFTFTSDMLTLLATYAEAIAEQGSFCNPSGALLSATNFHVDPNLAMRQTGWNRRARPGFHRAYVPDA